MTLPSVKLQGLEEGCVVDTAESATVYLATMENGAYVRLSSSARNLLRMVDGGMSFEAIAQQVGEPNAEVSATAIESAYRGLIERLGQMGRANDQSLLGLRNVTRIIRAPLVQRVSRVLAPAFRGQIAIALSVCLMLAAFRAASYPWNAAEIARSFWPSYALLILSLVAHEFGHASACARFGARPADIGVGIYLIYPAFFADVSDAWRLKRWQRVVVDLGGIFFQLLAGLAFLVAYEISGWIPFKVAILFVVGNCLFSLNPFLKFDGYWVIADILGVTNLRAKPRQLMQIAIDRARKRPTTGLRLSPISAAALVLCCVLAIAVWAWFLFGLLPMLWSRLIGYPALSFHFFGDLIDHQIITRRRFVDFLSATYITIFGVALLRRIGWRLVVSLLSFAGIQLKNTPSAVPADTQTPSNAIQTHDVNGTNTALASNVAKNSKAGGVTKPGHVVRVWRFARRVPWLMLFRFLR